MNSIDLATKILSIEEGFRGEVYRDTEGYPTVGYGLKVGRKDAELPDLPPMPKDVAFVWLQTLVRDAEENVRHLVDNWDELSELRKAVLISMGYQLGVMGLAGFNMTLNSIEQSHFHTAGTHMLDSLWARQTPRRAERHARMMEDNELCRYYLI